MSLSLLFGQGGNNDQQDGNSVSKKIIYCAASNEAEKEQWINVIRDAVVMIRDKE